MDDTTLPEASPPTEQPAPVAIPAPAPAPVEASAEIPRRPKRKYKRYNYGDRRTKAPRIDREQPKPQAVLDQEAVLREAGLLGADLPEAEVLQNVADDTKSKLSKLEQDKLSLAEALARAAEIEESDDGSRHGAGNEFDFDQSIVPAGWHYEWKRDTVLNERSPAYFTALAKSGWQAVPRSRHTFMMPPDWPGETIMRGGMILMQIPKQIIEQRRAEELTKARGEVQNKLAQLSGRSVKNGASTFERSGRATRDFGPILSNNNETAYAGQLVGGHLVPGGRSIVR